MHRTRSVRRIILAALGITVLVTSGAVALARTAPSSSGNGPHVNTSGSQPTIVVDYFKDGKFLQTDTSSLAGFDLGWKATGCSGKWLAKPVIVLPESKGAINSSPIPAPCNGKTPIGAIHNTPIETVDVLGWLVTGSSWWIGWSITGFGPGATKPLLASTTGIHVYLYGGNTFTHEALVSSTGKIVKETTPAKIPAGANEAFIHVANATGT